MGADLLFLNIEIEYLSSMIDNYSQLEQRLDVFVTSITY